MLDFGFYNMDCMEGMRQFPDKYFDLAIVDPPYGDGNILNEGGVLEQIRTEVRQVQEDTSKTRMSGNQTEHGAMRTGGTWARKYAKKSFRGMLRRGRNTLKNCFASHGIRSFGAVTISVFRPPDAF